MLLSMYVVDITIFSGHLIAGKKSFKTPFHKKKYFFNSQATLLIDQKDFPKSK